MPQFLCSSTLPEQQLYTSSSSSSSSESSSSAFPPSHDLNRGWASRRLGADRREGRLQRAVRRAFIASGKPLTTRELVQWAYPRLKQVPDIQWRYVRLAAERWAVRVKPRSRPLRWRAKPGALDNVRRGT